MNKKILMSLVVIGIVAGVTLGITGAYFSDTATSTSNSFHSGTLDLKLANAGQLPYRDSVTGTFAASDMTPGVSTATGKVWLKNTGSVAADHVRIISVVNTPSDNGINEPECKAYNGEWKWWPGTTNARTLCVLPASVVKATCDSYGGKWYNFGTEWSGYGDRCYAEINEGFKDDIGGWNDIDNYLEVVLISYNGESVLKPYPQTWSSPGGYDVNGNGYVDLDDLEDPIWTNDGRPLDNLRPAPGTGGNDPKAFEMTVKLHGDADNHYQTDKDGIKITFQLDQNAS